MLEFFKKIFRIKTVKLGVLFALILTVAFVSRESFLFVRASISQVNVYPGKIYFSGNFSDKLWRETDNIFFPDLSSLAGPEEFTTRNSAYMTIGNAPLREFSGLSNEEQITNNEVEVDKSEFASSSVDIASTSETLVEFGIQDFDNGTSSETVASSSDETSEFFVDDIASSSEEVLVEGWASSTKRSEEVEEAQSNEPGNSLSVFASSSQGVAGDDLEEVESSQIFDDEDIDMSSSSESVSLIERIKNFSKGLMFKENALAEGGLASTTPAHSAALYFSEFFIPNTFDNATLKKLALNFSLSANTNLQSGSLHLEIFYLNEWRQIGELEIAEEMSNQNNGGYYKIPIKQDISPEAISESEWRLIFKNDEEEPNRYLVLYLDALWLELGYLEGEEGEETLSAGVFGFDPEQRLGECIIGCEDECSEKGLDMSKEEQFEFDFYCSSCENSCLAEVEEERKWWEDYHKRKSSDEEAREIKDEKIQKKDGYELALLSEKTDFEKEENPVFQFRFKKDRNIIADIGMSLLSLVSDEFDDWEIKADIKDWDESEDGPLPDFLINYNGDGEFVVEIDRSKMRQFKPGKLEAQIELVDSSGSGFQVDFSQDFSWGVLSLNVNQSVFQYSEDSPEIAYLQMGVLDERGHTLCGADLRLEITSPEGIIEYFSTDDGDVVRNPKCAGDTVIQNPDYWTYYQVYDPGRYSMRLIADTDNGQYEISDEFFVEEKVSFEIERIGPTRIYPWSNYKMTFKVRANEDFQGEFKEFVPSSFEIINSDEVFVRENENEKELSWSVDWRAGNEYFYSYDFDAPNVSPEFFLLGPSYAEASEGKPVARGKSNKPGEIVNDDGMIIGYGEARQWQIASDAEVDIFSAEQITAITDTAGGGATTLLTLDASNFTAGDTYFIYAQAGFSAGANNVRSNYYINYNSTAQHTGWVDPTNGSAGEGQQISWFDVYTQPGTTESVNITFDAVSGQTFGFNAQIFAINLSNLQDSDWEYNVNTPSGADLHDTTPTSKASLTLSDADGTKDWLIFAMEELESNDANGNNYQGDIFDGTNGYMAISQEAENADEVLTYALFRAFDDVAQNTVFSMRVSDSAAGTSHNHTKSRVFALNLDVFESSKNDYAAPGTGITDATWYEVGNLNSGGNYSPQTTGDQVLFTSFTDDTAAGSALTDTRLRVNSATVPSGWSWAQASPISFTGRTAYDSTDVHLNNVCAITSIPTTGYTIGLEAYELNGNSQVADEYSLTVFSKEKASTLGIFSLEQYESDGVTAIPNGNWTSNSVWFEMVSSLATDDESDLNFYMNLATTTESFSSTTTEPYNACQPGVNYSGCSSKIWVASSTLNWFGDDWAYRKPLVINAAQVASHETGFTFLATTTDPDFRTVANGGHMGSSTAADIVITDSSGTTTLDYERVSYSSTTGEIVLWVKADISSTTNTTLYLYYGNSSVTQDYSTSTGAWDSDYVGVYHLEDSPVGGGTFSDSSQYGNTATFVDPDSSSDSEASGYIGGAVELSDGAVNQEDYITMNPVANDFAGNDITWSAWINVPADLFVQGASPEDFGTVFGINTAAGGNVLIAAINDGTAANEADNRFGAYDGSWQTAAYSSTQVATGSWQYVTFVHDDTSGNAYIYANGNQEGSFSTALSIGGTDLFAVGTEYDSGPAASDWLTGFVDEVMISDTPRSATYIKTQHNNMLDSTSFVSFGSEVTKNQSVGGFLNVDSITDLDGYKWQAMVCYDGGTCSTWQSFNSTIPNFKVDSSAPQAPGDLSPSSNTDRTITLDYGYPAVDSNFSEYKIFYKADTPGVTELDIEINSTDESALGNRLYNGETSISISDLQPNTTYYFNIWAYDAAGNKASATEVSASTALPGRANTVRYVAGTYSSQDGSTGQNSDEFYTFDNFNFYLAEESVSIHSAYIIFEAQIEAYGNAGGDWTGYELAFDACQEPCTANASTSPSRLSVEDTTTLLYAEGESAQVRILLDVTDEAQISSYGGAYTNLEAELGYRIDGNSNINTIASARAELVVTYGFDSDSESYTNTVVYPLEADYGATGTRPTEFTAECTWGVDCPEFQYNFQLPEYITSPGATQIDNWFETYAQNDANNGVDVYMYVGHSPYTSSSSLFIHESVNSGTQGNIQGILFDSVPDFSLNSLNTLAIYSQGNADNALLGGEVFTTYTASSAVALKTRTVSLPMGVMNNGGTTATTYDYIDVYFPENGKASGKIDIKKAWFRIKSHDSSSGDGNILVDTRVGDNSTSSAQNYYYDPGGTVVNPVMTFFHLLPESDYSELELANGETPKRIYISTTNDDTSLGGMSIELMITYAYTDENEGYLTSLALFAGQSLVDPARAETTATITSTMLPEPAGYKTIVSAGLHATHLITDGDGNVATDFFVGANMAESSPVCANSFAAENNGYNSFVDLNVDVTSILSTLNNQSYEICFSNDQGGDIADGGSKANGQLIYTYQYFNPVSVSATANEQYEPDGFSAITNGNWITDSDVWLSSLAQDTSTTSNSLYYYFELIDSDYDYATSTNEPSSFCDSGTAFGSCSSQIWRDSASTSVSWYDPDWLYRKKLTINANQIVATYSDFPVLATTSDSNLAIIASGGGMASSTGGDILVTQNDGTTLLDYQLEYYNPTSGEIYLWIETDISSTTNVDLYLYYGNSTTTVNYENVAGVWDADYVGIYHFDESPANGGTFYDSSTYGNDGTFTDANSNTDTAYSGNIDGAVDFNGDADYVVIDSVASDLGSGDFTVSFWFNSDFAFTGGEWDAMIGINPALPDTGNGLILSVGNPGAGDNNVSAYDGADSAWEASGSYTIADSTWHYINYVVNGTTAYIYVDGILDTSHSYAYSRSATDRWSIAHEWDGGTASDWLDGAMDEIRVSKTAREEAWLKTNFNNQIDSSNFVSFASEESYSDPTIEGKVSITSIPDSAIGYKWQVKVCNDDAVCTNWDDFDLPPNFKVDSSPPTAPGNLTVSTTTATSITLDFGAVSTDTNFSHYKIFYKSGVSGVDEEDTEHSDSNLLDRLYNGVGSTTISNLESETQYVINIFAYDLAGNKTSANEVVVLTESAAHARANSVRFQAGYYSSSVDASGQDSNTDYTLPNFNFKLAETGVEIKDAFIIFEAQINAYTGNVEAQGYDLAFDVCEEPCTANAWNGTNTVEVNDNTVLAYSEGSSNQVRILMDVLSEGQLEYYTGDWTELEAEVGYHFDYAVTETSIANAKATLVVTYSYDSDNSSDITRTVYYPLDSQDGQDSGTRQAVQADDCLVNTNCPLFDYTFTAPEASIGLADWTELYSANDSHGGSDLTFNVNLQGYEVNSDTIRHESVLGGTQGHVPRIIISDVYGFTENEAQEMEIRATSPGGATYYLMGGEVAETFIASSSAITKTRTVSYPLGVISQGNSTASNTVSVDVYFPENGEGSGVVNVESAWLRLLSSDTTSADEYLYVDTKVGDEATSSAKAYHINAGGTVIKPSFTIIHIIASSSYSELELANNSTPKKVSVDVGNNSNQFGGVSAELMISYTFSSEANGYLAPIELFAGQTITNGNSTSDSSSVFNVYLSELRGTKSMIGGLLTSSFMISDSDGVMPSGFYNLDANIATNTPICSGVNYIESDNYNAFGEFYQNVSSSLNSTNNQAYNLCMYIDNSPDVDSGAKMNSSFKYLYSWQAPPTEFTQSDWRWYENNDSITPVTPLAAENTSISNVFVGEAVRLRINMAITKEALAQNSQTFKLQYAAGSDCSLLSSWTDIGAVGDTSAEWIGYNNPAPTDGVTLASYLLASSTVYESYEESSPTNNNPNLVPVGGYGEWDFALYNRYASSSDYCFRLTKGNGTELDDYLSDSYPIISTAPANTKPNDPSNLQQYLGDQVTTITNTDWINENDVWLRGAATDPNLSEDLTLYFELIPNSSSFTTATSEPSGACTSGTSYNVCAGQAPGWTYRRDITLSTSTKEDNFQVALELGADNFEYSKASTSGQDLRFYDLNDNELSYWIENWNSSGTSTVWINVATSGTLSFSMYYGNTSATAASNGTTTFDFFDDFEGGFNSNKWTNVGGTYSVTGGEFVGTAGDSILYVSANGYSVTTQSIIEFRMRSDNSSPSDWDGGIGIGTWNFVDDQNSAETMGIDFARWWGDVTDSDQPRSSLTTHHDYRVILDGTTAYYYDDTEDRSHSRAGATNGTLYLVNDGEGGGGGTIFDHIFVRKYATNTPSLSLGNETTGSIWYVQSSTGDYRTNSFVGTTSIINIPESSAGYKWQAMACDKDGYCSDWNNFNATTPNFRIDTTAPTIPGDLIFSSSTPTTITLDFGATTTEDNFERYRIFYYEGTSQVSESDTEHTSDPNLLDIEFNGAASTTIINLSAGTEYLFNIWAYDLAGNVASATVPVVGTTTSSYTAPEGQFAASTQKADGSGAVDIVIQVDDADNDNTLAVKLFYEEGEDCIFDPASTSQMTLDETDSEVSATYGDPVADNNYEFQLGSSSGWIVTAPGQNFVFFDWLSMIDEPTANTTYCMGMIVSDNAPQSANSATATRLILLDNVAPSTPGKLSSSTKDFNSVDLVFGSQSSDLNFDHYEIWYQEGTSSPDLLDTQHIDTDLGSANYGGTASTTVSGLKSNTWYAFNIWAFDSYGNKASSTFITIKTNAKPSNISADLQLKSDYLTSILNGAWTDEDQVWLKSSVHDQDIGDTVTFYFEFLENSGTFTSATIKPSNTCTSTVDWVDCSSHIWEVSTTTYDLPTDWYDPDWLYRKKITINASQVAANETDFVVLATTTSSDFISGARTDGYDFIFTDSTGTSTVPHEIESYNSSTGELVAWIKTDISSTVDTELYVYWGNENQETDLSSSTLVWADEYRGVWHLEETVVDESSAAGAHLDSSQYYNNANQFGNNEISAWIGTGQELDGNDYFYVFDDASLDLSDQVNIDFWAKGVSSLSDGTSSTTYSIVGTDTFLVPQGVYEITVKAWGAGGAGGAGGSVGAGGAGGAGAYAETTISVIPGETLNVHVGGGGNGGDPVATGGGGGSGGGRTEISRAGTILAVAGAGAGGGGGDNSSGTAGGAGGAGGADTGVTGGSSSNADGGTGGTQVAGGTGGIGGGNNEGENAGTDGGLQSGGDGGDGGAAGAGAGSGAVGGTTNGGNAGIAVDFYGAGGAGGSGYYGGGGGASADGADAGGGGGGGGSSYVIGYNSTRTAGSGVTTPNTGDSDYQSGVGAGGAAGGTGSSGTDGGDGLLVVYYTPTTKLVSKGTDAYSVDLDTSDVVSVIANHNTASSTSDSSWHHITMNYDRGEGGTEELKLYIDGVLADSADYAGTMSINASNIIVGDNFTGIIDELRIASTSRDANWVLTNHNNLASVSNFMTIGTTDKVTSYYESALLLNIDDSSTGYKWQTMACDADGDCSAWAKFNTTIPNLKIDTLDPSDPGALTEYSKTSNSITVSFGAETTEANFREYKIFYSTSTPVDETDWERSSSTDTSLGLKNYNNESTISFLGLTPDTTYYFNIWAYDVVGHKASSSATLSVTTDAAVSSPGAAFYTKGDSSLYYRVWDGTQWLTESTGPSLSGGTGAIRHIRTKRSDDGGKILVLAQVLDGTTQEWWATVYSYVADTFDTATQLGAGWTGGPSQQLMTGCLASLSGKEFIIVRGNNGADGTQVYSWNQTDGWTSEGAGPDPAAILNACKLVRRPGTDNYLLITQDNDNDVGSAYYYGGSTYGNSWTTWTEHSTANTDVNNFAGDAFFDPSDNTRGAINFSDSGANTYTMANYFICDNSSINYGAAYSSPSTAPDNWGGSWVQGEFFVNSVDTGISYYLGRDNTDDLNVYKVDVTSPVITWSTLTNGDDISGGDLYLETNDAQKPFAAEFYKDDYALVSWIPNTNPSIPQYRELDATGDSLDAASSDVPDATSDRWTRLSFYKDPSEDEFLAIYQNDNTDYSAIFYEGGNDRWYNTTDHPASNQVWTNLASTLTVSDIDDENISFAFASYNSPPNAPTGMAQFKEIAGTSISNQGWTNEASTTLRVSVYDVDTSERLKVYFEVVANTDDFTSTTTEPENYCATSTVFDLCNSKIWFTGTSTLGDYSVTPYTIDFTVASTSDSTIGYKWRAIACDDGGECSAWSQFDAVTPNFYVDTIAPTAPGALTDIAVTSDSVTLQFGGQSVDTNFDEYRIYYATSTTPVYWYHSRHIDSDLGSENYGGTSDTIVLNLSSSTLYYFNIWAVDLAGNIATASPEVSTTTSALPNIDQTSYRWQNDDGADVNSNTAVVAADTSLTDMYIGERATLRIQLENNGGDSTDALVYKLQFENQTDNPGSWTDVGVATEISYSFGLAGLDSDAITSAVAAANSNTWVNGTWHENTELTGSNSLDYNSYTEFGFMIHTANALTSKTYRLRLYNSTDDISLDDYTSYPTLTTTSTDNTRYSKGEEASLPSSTGDETYYLDPLGYTYVAIDEDDRDAMAVTQYPVFYFAKKHTNSSDSITATWQGQSDLAPSTNNVVLQVYSYGSPNQWITVDTESVINADNDFELTAYINSDLSEYYDGSNWTYWRVYQASGAETLSTDQFSIDFSTPTAETTQLHYRWRDDDGDETGATWREITDQGDPVAPTLNLNVDENVRLRIQVSNPGAGPATNYSYQLQYSTSTGDCSLNTYWEDVANDYSAHWNSASSSNFVGPVSTTRQLTSLTGYTYVNGTLVEDPSFTSSALTLNEDRYTELEYTILATGNSITAATYCFRVANSGSEIYSYSVYPVITMAGNTNIAPSFSVYPDDNGSASTSPTSYGTDITFDATAGDSDGDDYYLAICKTNSITPGTDGPPICTAGEWCISDATASSSQATCTTTSEIATENNDWYAFACDKVPGFGIAKCSAMSQGEGTAENNSPFVVNHPPAYTAIETVVDNQDPGSTFRIKATADDPDIYNGEDTLTMYVCATDAANFSGCTGATLCAAASSSDPYCDIVDTAPSPPDTTDYYVYVFDNHNLGSSDNSRAGSYTINNTLPSLGPLVLNSGSDITLNFRGEGGTPVSAYNSSVVDLNGCQSLVSATAVVYFSNVSGDESCTENGNDCYQIGVSSCAFSDCTGASDTSAEVTCSTTLEYYAIPTDDYASNPNEPYGWLSYLNVFDGTNYSATNSEEVEILTSLALDVTESFIDFGSEIAVGENSGTNNATSTIINAGNSPLDTNINGTDMEDGTAQPSGIIDATNIKWDLVEYFDYSSDGSVLTENPTWTNVDIYAPKATSALDVTDRIYWGIGIPFGKNISTYEGQNYFQAQVDADGW